MPISDWMTVPAPAIDPYTRIDDAKRIMLKLNHRTLAIVEDENLVGIITRRDILKFDPASRIPVDFSLPQNKTEYKFVEQIMTKHVSVVNEKDSLGNAARIMIENKFNALPVINDTGLLVGMLTTPNLFEFIFSNSTHLPFSIPVSKCMSTAIISLSPQATLWDARTIMMKEFIRSIPILNKGDLVGIVTRTDLLMLNPSLFSQTPNDLQFINETTLEYIMTSKPITVDENTPIPEIAKRMLEYQIHSIPVLNNNEKLTGIVTETDLFQLIADNA